MISIARLYSKALFEIDQECYDQLNELRKALSPEVLEFFNSSLISFSNKKQVLDLLPFSDSVLNFLCLLTRHHRWSYLDSIFFSYKDLLDQKQKILRGVVYAAKKLSKEQVKEIESSLQENFEGQKLLLESQEQKDLIGGLRVEIQGKSLDDSIHHHLKQFRAQAGFYGTSNSSI